MNPSGNYRFFNSLDGLKINVPHNKKIIAFDLYVSSKSILPYIETIYRILSHWDTEKYHPLLLFYSNTPLFNAKYLTPGTIEYNTLSNCPCDCFSLLSSSRIDILSHLDFISTIFVHDFSLPEHDILPDHVKVVGMPHGTNTNYNQPIDGPVHWWKAKHGQLFYTLDFYCAPNSQENMNDLYIDLFSSKKRTPLGHIPAGYLKWDTYIEESKKQIPDSILYMPHEVGWSEKFLYLKPEYQLTVLERLLSQFPNHPIIYRPAPVNRSHYIVNEIQNRFSHFKNFTIDIGDNLTQTYCKTKVLLTDETSGGYTLAMTTFRPSIFLVNKGGIFDPDINILADSIDHSMEIIHDILLNPNKYQEKIKETTQNRAYNLGTACKYIAKNMEIGSE